MDSPLEYAPSHEEASVTATEKPTEKNGPYPFLSKRESFLYGIITSCKSEAELWDRLHAYFQIRPNLKIRPTAMLGRGVFTISLNFQQRRMLKKQSWVCRVYDLTTHSMDSFHEMLFSHFDDWVQKQNPGRLVSYRHLFDLSYSMTWAQWQHLHDASVSELERLSKLGTVTVLSKFRPFVVLFKGFDGGAAAEFAKFADCVDWDKSAHTPQVGTGEGKDRVVKEDITVRKCQALPIQYAAFDRKMETLMRTRKFENAGKDDTRMLIRYRHGDFLRAHHDSGRDLVRGYTVVLYVNDVKQESGGQTTFTQLMPQLHVQPKAGDLLLWLNGVRDGTTYLPDISTEHCGGEIIDENTKKLIVTYFGNAF